MLGQVRFVFGGRTLPEAGLVNICSVHLYLTGGLSLCSVMPHLSDLWNEYGRASAFLPLHLFPWRYK